MSYARRWANRALVDTLQYWTLLRAVLTISTPILASILWVVFKPWGGWWPVIQAAVLSVMGFFSLWGIAFAVCWVLAPSKLEHDLVDKHSQAVDLLEATNNRLRSEMVQVAEQNNQNPEEERIEALVAERLAQMTDVDKSFISWLLDHGEVNIKQAHTLSGLTAEEAMQAATKGENLALVKGRPGITGLGQRFVWVNPVCEGVLRTALHHRSKT
jgi:hypothetical protein